MAFSPILRSANEFRHNPDHVCPKLLSPGESEPGGSRKGL